MTSTSTMMSLGLFVFKMDTAPFEQYSRDTTMRIAKKQANSLGPVHQNLGLDSDTLELSGYLVPPITGGAEAIEKLRNMQLNGKSWNLVDGAGKDLGAWFIESLKETGTNLKHDGTARKIEFSLSLRLNPDLKALGDLKDSQ